MSLLVTILVGALAGWLAGQVMSGKGYGFIVNLVLGIVGSVVGNWVFDRLNIDFSLGSSLLDSIVIAAAGAIIVLFVAGLIKK